MDAAILRANLQALATVDAVAAQRLSEVRVPAGVVAAWGHDGVRTFRVEGNGSGPRWLGRSGAPSVRAEALIRRFDAGSGNVLLIGAGQGCLLRQLLGCLGPHQAVFVHETDWLDLRLVLTLHDFSDALSQRRLILTGPGEHADLEEALFRAAQDNRGHLMPERMLAWPWLSAAELEVTRDRLARVSDRVSAHRVTEMERLRREIEERSRSGAERDGVLVCTTSTQSDTAAWLEHVAAALAELGVPRATFAPVSCDQRHPLALLDRLAQLRPGLALLLDCVRSDLGQFLPVGLPVASWLGPDAAISPAAVTLANPKDTFFVTSASISRRVAEAGVPAEHVAVLPFGVVAEHPVEPAGPVGKPSLLVLAEGADCSPQANGVDLDSQVALWRALCTVLLDAPDSGRKPEPESCLRQAEKRSGISLQDRGLRDKFRDLTSRTLWPTLRKLRLIRRLRGSDTDLRLVGNGWATFPELADCWQAAGQAPEAVNLAMAHADLFIDLEADGQVRFRHVLALSRGCVILWEAATEKQVSTAWETYGLGHRTPPSWSAADQLAAQVHRLARSGAGRADLSEFLRSQIASSCRMSDRLAVLLSAGRASRPG